MTVKQCLQLFDPRLWPAWLALSLLWLATKLPISLQLKLGKWLGTVVYHCSSKLRRITQVNIDLCFPELPTTERQKLIQKNFESLGIGLIETAMAWWLPNKRLQQCDIIIEGYEHVDAALALGKGIILLGPHYACLEMIGRLLGSRYPFAVMYRPHKNRLISFLQTKFRARYGIKQIARHRMRELLHNLNNNISIWYAYDVDGGEKRSVFVPFFGITTASLTAVSRIASLSGAAIVPISFYRIDNGFGYKIKLSKALDNFPGENFTEDAIRLNSYIEAAIREKPEQYIWQYKRFKTRPQGEARFY
jgi:Kdo2-lipid IVA lauroyltransferase/acyltransferase